MQTMQHRLEWPTNRNELVVLLAASFATVLVLSLSLSDGALFSLPQLRVRQLMALGLLAAVGAFGVYILWSTLSAARQLMIRTETETAELRRKLTAAEAIVKAEQQVLIYWEPDRGLTVVAHNVTSVLGLPSDPLDLLRFGVWLDPRAADDLKAALDRLFSDGLAFNLLLRTAQGGHLEADGRAAGGRAVLRLRDIAGHKRDLMRILDQHRQLTRDIRASRALLDALPMPVWICGQAGRIDWVNTAYVRSVEATDANEVRERQITLLESRQLAAVERSLKSGKAYRKRTPLIIEGSRRPHDVVIIPLGDSIVGAAIDVTAVEAAKGQLDRETQAFDRTLDKVATAVAIFGADQRLLFFNAAFANLWQLDRQWLATRPSNGEILDRLRELSRLPAIVDYREWRSRWLAVYKSGQPMEDLLHLPDGRMVHVTAEQRPDGGATCLYDDATERFALESRYRTLIDVQRETLDSLKEGVAVFASDGRLRLCNAPFAAIWKLSRPALDEGPHIDAIVTELHSLLNDDQTWGLLTRAVTSFTGVREALAGQMVRADGSVVDYATAPLPDGSTLITFADVTAARRYQRALIERNEALVAADRLKNQFISHVSYELRTPLTNIIGFGEMLTSELPGPLNLRQRDYLDDMAISSRTLLAIIDDILDLATIDAGALELKLAPAGVRGVIDAAILGVRESALRADVGIDITIEPDVQDFIADEARIRQVLYNLLTNAIGFSTAGSRVALRCGRQDGMIAITVEDQGPGIPKDEQVRIFDRFESRSHGSRHRGAGLGLSIVKSLVELHGGGVELESEPGRGTRVTVRFPERGDDQGEPDLPMIAERRNSKVDGAAMLA